MTVPRRTQRRQMAAVLLGLAATVFTGAGLDMAFPAPVLVGLAVGGAAWALTYGLRDPE